MNTFDALVKATHVIGTYCRTAESNLGRSEKPFLAIETSTLKAVLTIPGKDGPEHVIAMRFDEKGGASPLSLELIFDIHSAIFYVNATLLASKNRPLEESESQLVRCKWVDIYARSAFLSEFLRHAGTVISTPGAQRALNCRAGLIKETASPAMLAELEVLNRAHKERLVAMAARIAHKPYPAAATIAKTLTDFTPVTLPGTMTFREHEGVRIINDTWFPAQYAKPQIEKIALEQAKAMSQRPR